MKTLPYVALVGRPNVGKSTLYNRLIGKRAAVVAPVAGTTRDRLEHVAEWDGRRFMLMDMAGIEPAISDDTEIGYHTQAQVQKALEKAQVIFWIVDARSGLTQLDYQLANALRTLNKKIFVVANKCDHARHEEELYQFTEVGFGEPIGVSALNSRGIHELLDALLPYLPEGTELPEVPSEIRISIIGRPNVGKSTLLNALASDERSVVSDVPGTTRDTVDTVIPAKNVFGSDEVPWETVRIIDTAGIRRRGKIEQGIEAWSLVRTLDAIDNSEVVLLLLNAEEGIVSQDMHIAEQILKSGRPVVLLVNKWDQMLNKGVEDEELQEQFLDRLRHAASFLYWAPVLFLSATEGINVEIVGKLVQEVYAAWSRDFPQAELDEVTKFLVKTPRLKNLQKITLEHSKPPVFHIHVEGKELPHFSTHRYIENALRDYFDIGQTPIKIWSVPSVDRFAKNLPKK